MLNWRWYIFWIKDYMSGGYIHKAYNEIKKGNDSDKTDEKLGQLLDSARKDTEFYKDIKSNDIKDFPIINKVTINENYEKFISSKYKNQKLHKMSTSGSTGIPFTILQNKEKRKRVLAELLYYNMQCGYQFGRKQIFFRIWTEKNRKTKLQSFLQNLIAKDISNLDDNNLKEISEDLKSDKKLSNILSYASTLDKLSKYMLQNNYKPQDFSIRSIVSSSEVLQEETRQNLKKVFGCNIVSRYSNQENGVLAQDCVEYQEMHLNNVNYYIEFLKLDSDEEAEEGEIARVVITDLYNYAMPMIRYDTGDLAIYSNTSNCSKKEKVITEIYGRKIDLIYDTKGDIVSPHAISVNMWGIAGIKQFKFQQILLDKYRIILHTERNKRIDEDSLMNRFKNILGNDAIIEIEYTEEIPASVSGKRKYIENRMKI